MFLSLCVGGPIPHYPLRYIFHSFPLGTSHILCPACTPPGNYSTSVPIKCLLKNLQFFKNIRKISVNIGILNPEFNYLTKKTNVFRLIESTWFVIFGFTYLLFLLKIFSTENI